MKETKKTKTFNITDTIVLEEACITGFRTIDRSTVEVTIESRPYNTLYRIKRVPTNNWRPEMKSCFLQVLRKA